MTGASGRRMAAVEAEGLRRSSRRRRARPRDPLSRGLDLPRGPHREKVRVRGRDYELSGDDVRVMTKVGAFRVVPANELRASNPRTPTRPARDLERLREHGLVKTMPYVVGRTRTTLVTLTERGRDLLEARRLPDSRDAQQKFYAGISKPRELAHDARVHAAYERAVEKLEGQGARVRRVVLEEELKADYQRFLQRGNEGRRDGRGEPERDQDAIARWAREHELPVPRWPRRAARRAHRIRRPRRPARRRGHRDRDAALPGCACRGEGGLRVLAVPCRRRAGRRRVRFRSKWSRRGSAGRGGAPAMTQDERIAAVAKHGKLHAPSGRLPGHGDGALRRVRAAAGTAPTRTSGTVRRSSTSSLPWLLVVLATRYTAADGRARIFHVHGRALYAAIDEPHNRNRKPITLARAIERLMLLDAVLAQPELRWLGTEREKVEYFRRRTRLREDEMPLLSVRRCAQADRSVLPRQAADWRDAGRTLAPLPLPGYSRRSGGLPGVPSPARRAVASADAVGAAVAGSAAPR